MGNKTSCESIVTDYFYTEYINSHGFYKYHEEFSFLVSLTSFLVYHYYISMENRLFVSIVISLGIYFLISNIIDKRITDNFQSERYLKTMNKCKDLRREFNIRKVIKMIEEPEVIAITPNEEGE